MSLRCLVTVCLVLAVESALIKTRNIPVEVVYDRSNPVHYGNRNLDAKIQLSSDELLKLKLSDDIINEGQEEEVEGVVEEVGNPYGVRNLDEKVQLSQEEIGQAVKFLPNTVENDDFEKPTEKPQPEKNNLVDLLKKAEEIAYSGLNSIRSNIENASQAISNAKPSAETWERLNQTVDAFFKDQYRNVNLKDDKPPENNNNNNNEFFQQFVNNFVNVVQNFVGNNMSPSSEKPGGSEDEQQGQQGPQNFFQNFVNGMTQIVSNFNNINPQGGGQKPPGQEDTGVASTGDSNNFNFNQIVTSIQNFFSGLGGQGNPSQGANNQSDTGVQPNPSNPGAVIQGAISQFQGTINNWFSQGTTSPPPASVQGDEGTGSSTTQSSNPFGGINQINQINQAFQNVTGGGGGSNPITSGAQAIGSQFGQLVGQGQPGSNPIVSGAQAIGSQFGQLTGQGGNSSGNPFASGAEAIGNQIGQFAGGQGGNPLQNLQGALGGGGSSTEKGKIAEKQEEGLSSTEATVVNSEEKKKDEETVEKVKDEEIMEKVE